MAFASSRACAVMTRTTLRKCSSKFNFFHCLCQPLRALQASFIVMALLLAVHQAVQSPNKLGTLDGLQVCSCDNKIAYTRLRKLDGVRGISHAPRPEHLPNPDPNLDNINKF